MHVGYVFAGDLLDDQRLVVRGEEQAVPMGEFSSERWAASQGDLQAQT